MSPLLTHTEYDVIWVLVNNYKLDH